MKTLMVALAVGLIGCGGTFVPSNPDGTCQTNGTRVVGDVWLDPIPNSGTPPSAGRVIVVAADWTSQAPDIPILWVMGENHPYGRNSNVGVSCYDVAPPTADGKEVGPGWRLRYLTNYPLYPSTATNEVLLLAWDYVGGTGYHAFTATDDTHWVDHPCGYVNDPPECPR